MNIVAALPAGRFGKLSLLAGGLFLLSAALQWNDPDPLPWIVIYGAAGAASILAAFADRTPQRSRARALAASVGAAAAVWVAFQATATLGHLTVSDLFRTMHAETPAIEESRELFGLLLIVVWMGVVFFRQRQV